MVGKSTNMVAQFSASSRNSALRPKTCNLCAVRMRNSFPNMWWDPYFPGISLQRIGGDPCTMIRGSYYEMIALLDSIWDGMEGDRDECGFGSGETRIWRLLVDMEDSTH